MSCFYSLWVSEDEKQKKGTHWKTKNRGGERLQECQVFKSFGLTSETNSNQRETCEVILSESTLDMQAQELFVEAGSGLRPRSPSYQTRTVLQ